MSPYAWLHDLTLDQAAKLIAHPDTDPTVIRDCRNELEQAVRRGELPVHDVAVSIGSYIAPASADEPDSTAKVPHVRRADLQAFCERRGIPWPYAELPALSPVAQDILSRRLAWFEDYCRRLSDAELHGWQRKEFFSVLRRQELFKKLKSDAAWDKFWTPALKVLKRARDARDRKK